MILHELLSMKHIQGIRGPGSYFIMDLQNLWLIISITYSIKLLELIMLLRNRPQDLTIWHCSQHQELIVEILGDIGVVVVIKKEGGTQTSVLCASFDIQRDPRVGVEVNPGDIHPAATTNRKRVASSLGTSCRGLPVDSRPTSKPDQMRFLFIDH